MPKVILIGSAYPFRGGLAAFNERLAVEFQRSGWEVEIWTFTVQYPALLFPGTSQYTDGPPPEGLGIVRKVNSVNPFNWLKCGFELKRRKADLLIAKFWLPFMAPALGTILGIAKKNNFSKVICIVDNLFPHEKRLGDRMLIKYFLKMPDYFVSMSEKVTADLGLFIPQHRIKQIDHPLYDNFGDIVEKKSARTYLNLPQDTKIILFFGFIRKYKGLQLLLEALLIVREQLQNFKVVIAGEFYEDSKPYFQFIEKHGLSDVLILKTHFISDEDVKYYFSSADVLVQPYINATQSGVTPLAYHFDLPMVVTDVGSLARLVHHKVTGLVCAPNPDSLAKSLIAIFDYNLEEFKERLKEAKKKLSWKNFVDGILSFGHDLQS